MTVEDNVERPHRLRRPDQLESLTPDQIVAVVLRLAMEVSVLRDRLSTHEQLLSDKGVLTRDDVEGFTPSAEDAAARIQARTLLIDGIIKDLAGD